MFSQNGNRLFKTFKIIFRASILAISAVFVTILTKSVK